MLNLVDVTYAQTGDSLSTNNMGMRDMQARAFTASEAQYLLLKAPPVSGKSRASMFLGLDKLFNQGVRKNGRYHFMVKNFYTEPDYCISLNLFLADNC